MRKLKIDWTELEAAFEMSSWETHHYLDLETGDVLVVTDEAARHVEKPPDGELSEWMQEMVKVARQVEEGYGTRYIGIPKADSHEGYRDMEHFISTVRDDRLRDQLWRAIQGRGAFRYFKDVLADYPDERERWFAFKERRIHERVVDWLESEEIEPTNPIEPPEVLEPEEEEAD